MAMAGADTMSAGRFFGLIAVLGIRIAVIDLAVIAMGGRLAVSSVPS
jgi:hypothetical protein